MRWSGDKSAPVRVAALYDIHSNLPAFEAVLQAVEALDVDLVRIGGDIVPGPMPRETLDRLIAMDRPFRCIRGNTDREVVAAFDGQDLSHLPASIQEITRWTARQLDRTHRDFLANLPATIIIDIHKLGPVLFCHAAPQDDTTIITKVTPAEHVRPLLANVTQSLIVCGHTHMPFVRQIGSKRLVNAGSVGMHYGNPGADWALLGPTVQLLHIAYDLERAAEQIRATAYPDAEDFAQNNVLQPGTEDEAIEVFERQAAKERERHVD
jgi:putative phosphoesterase